MLDVGTHPTWRLSVFCSCYLIMQPEYNFCVTQTGSHRELLVDDGIYARLTRRQADAVV